jgi:hypothetical protein
MKLDFQGNLLWAYDYGDTLFDQRFLHVKQAADSTLMLVGEQIN